MFKTAQAKPSHAVLQELECHRCGVVLVAEVPKGDASYQCVCGAHIELAAMKQAA
ncbi:MAG: hypothetical protein FJZ00_12795 [Candidatus Sericytochromatia bacterium]|uniref:Uncharacterized protein n=1 Tax=Candidatus Tanganyikabacteria bacterium TaxID=2961651 RepID=A0A937X521_9BACT|nr:hypothetical protein [Candidatus Tanganyikabacteria bacterium]